MSVLFKLSTDKQKISWQADIYNVRTRPPPGGGRFAVYVKFYNIKGARLTCHRHQARRGGGQIELQD